MFVQKELWRHMKRCSTKREHHTNNQCRKRVLRLAAVAKAEFLSAINTLEDVIKPVMAKVKAAKEVAGFNKDENTIHAR